MSEERNPVDQLIDLFVYAPIGLLYEREDVLPRLVNRGRNQVQVARVLSQLAVQRGQGQFEERLMEVLGPSGINLARVLTEVGAMLGLNPPPQPESPGAGTAGEEPPVLPDLPRPPGDEVAEPAGTAAEAPPALDDSTDTGSAASEGDVPSSTDATATEPRPSLPIARYDTLAARDIIPLLVDLSPAQRGVIRQHEAAHRNRKTVLHQIDRLGV